MIVPSIDIVDGRAVQLVGGEAVAIEAGDPRPLAARFGLVGEVAVVDIDAARGEGRNEGVIRELLELAPCRVGGGIRSYEDAVRWLDAGASKIVIGTAATEDLLARLPRERVVVALDERGGRVVDQGWRRTTCGTVVERLRALRGLAGGFLVTFVDVEGRMAGLPVDRVRELVAEAGEARVTVAGGVATEAEIAEADRLGADAQVGMALYSGAITLAGSVAAVLRTDRADGLWPTVVCDEGGVALGLAYSSEASLSEAVETGRGVYWSRSRGAIWRKGDTSGAVQTLVRVDVDCDRDALRFVVRQHGGGFCHEGTRTCFGDWRDLRWVGEHVASRVLEAPEGSYTARLLGDPGLLRAKLLEEAGELAEAEGAGEVAWEAADVVYFALVAMARAGVSVGEVERTLERRSLRVTRRPGNAKEGGAG